MHYLMHAASVYRPSETQKTSVKYNDSTPRWCETFDFVMVSAGSTLSINVMNKVGVMDVVTSLKLSKVRAIVPAMEQAGGFSRQYVLQYAVNKVQAAMEHHLHVWVYLLPSLHYTCPVRCMYCANAVSLPGQYAGACADPCG